MNHDWHELIQRYSEGRATPEETGALQEALKEDAGLRALYLDYMNLEAALGAVADAAAVETETDNEIHDARLSRFRWRPLAAAAACLTLALGAGLLHRRHSVERHADMAAIEAAQNAIAQMPPPPPALPAWMSPTASLLDLDLSRVPSSNSKHPL